MLSFKQYSKQYLEESTDASTKFEGVIVDCWNLKKDLIKSSNVRAFLNSSKSDKQWATTGKSPEEQEQILLGFQKVLKQKVKASGKAKSAGQTKPKISTKWTEITGKGVDTSKSDIVIGKLGVSVKGPKAQLMSGEQKESRATVISAVADANANNQIQEDLLKMVDSFITTTRTVGGETTETPKGMNVGTLLKKGKEGSLINSQNISAFEKMKDQKALKSTVEDTFKKAFNNKSVGDAFAWESMTGWEKFGGKTFGEAGDDKGRATHMLVWDYDLKKVKFDDCNKIKSNIAKKMSMKADMKSNSYKAEGKKAGYSFYQTVRLSVDVIFDRADEFQTEAVNRIEYGRKDLSEGVITEGIFKDLVGKTWGWFKEKMKKLWDWAVAQFVKLKETIVELFKEGIDKVLNFFEYQPVVRVNSTINLM